jgi:HK97 family phage major capsid protein
MTLKEMRARLKQAQDELTALKGKLDAGDATQEETKSVSTLVAEIKTLRDGIKESEDAIRAVAAIAGTEERGAPTGGTLTVPAMPKQEVAKFKSFGEQLQAIAMAGINKDASPDNRLIYQKAAGANEAIPSEGGFLVQEDFSQALMGLSHDMGDVMSRVRNLPISANSNAIKLPIIDQQSRATGSRWGGIRAYWAGEGDTVSSSQVKLAALELSLKKLMGIGYMTEELLADAAALESYMTQAFAEEIVWMVEDSIINGNGAGKPLGILNSGALITVTKESGQAADTIVGQNVLNMMARLPIRSMRSAVFLTNQDCLPQLWSLTHPGTEILMYQPPGYNGNVQANAPYGTLMGRPVIPIEYSATLGNAGDLMLFDLGRYIMIDKGGVKTASSMHVRFLYEEQTFRITYRCDGQPEVRQPLTPANSATTVSPFVILGERS